MKQLQIQSPAKLNLTLDILEKDKNGYHRVRSIMMPYWDLVDEITFKKAKKHGVHLAVKGVGVQILRREHKNLVMMAAQAFFSTAHITPAIAIELHKQIPLASGLGGGSSNAATTLLGLNKLYDFPLSSKQLLTLAKTLGTDVPFFLNPQLSIATHFGEKITPIKRQIKSPEKNLPTATLHFSKIKKHSTKNQYARLDLSLCGKQKSSTTKLLKLLKTSPKIWDPSWNSLLHNDFEQLFKKPTSPASKKPTSQITHLSGSGPARFTIRPTG